MKTMKKIPRVLIATFVAGAALAATGSAFAQVDRIVISDAPAVQYGAPQMVPVGISISIGWHGDRYWDGHRYWAHDDWMRHHPHDPGPRGHDHDDHHDH
ncbi:hypothetical protein [Pararobbsia silviterrae]|uniref:DUF2502 domain-containing protein n=1 Tax=Pararobbsia silviterrae TaxID=1792498 RepID=A0A494XAY4_9BURK|nr:hypothetical protein [Pararobbsia silviterrae]RKP47718.1 hypothetical protein D7S86_22385 [Pararobbsia silviterrae]